MNERLEVHEQFLANKKAGLFNTGRSTMSPSSASMVQPYFDEMLRTGKSIKLKCSLFNVTHQTLYRKILDGATYLALRCPIGPGELVKTKAEQGRYQVMKAQWKLESDEEGWIIHPNKFEVRNRLGEQIRARHQQAAMHAHSEAINHLIESTNWKKDFVEFVSSSAPGDEFIRVNVALMPADREFVRDICEQSKLDFDINETGTRLVVIKPDLS